MSAPASLVIAKLMLPETETPATLGSTPSRSSHATRRGLLDAISAGTLDGLRLAVNVGAMLISFLALTRAGRLLSRLRRDHVLHVPLSLARILGWLFAPLAWLMGDAGAGRAESREPARAEDGAERVRRVLDDGRSSSRSDPTWLSARSR